MISDQFSESDLETAKRLILSFFLESAVAGSFNGMLAANLPLQFGLDADLIKIISSLVSSDDIDCVFQVRDGNPHIKRLPILGKSGQLKLLRSETPNTFCLYPSRRLLRLTVADDMMRDLPFSRSLLLGEAQLSYVAFEMGVVGRYKNDPRYRLTFSDYMGEMSIADEFYHSANERDKTSIQSFGLGFDDQNIPHVVVFYRYLADLTLQHQQYWSSYTSDKKVSMCDQYFQSSILGEFYENKSVRYAIELEMNLINQLAVVLRDAPLFRSLMVDNFPVNVTAFLVPSQDNLNNFILSWDKILSDNININFFRGTVGFEVTEVRHDGSVIATKKGTIKLLEEWLVLNSEDTQILTSNIILPLAEIRKARQKPAHSFVENKFSESFHKERREILSKILSSLSLLRRRLHEMTGPQCVDIPEWLAQGQVEIF